MQTLKCAIARTSAVEEGAESPRNALRRSNGCRTQLSSFSRAPCRCSRHDDCSVGKADASKRLFFIDSFLRLLLLIKSHANNRY